MRVYDPTAESDAAPARMAPPLASLKGCRIGLLSNGKLNVDRFYAHVERLLRDEHGVEELVFRKKPDMSKPAPPQVIAELSGCDAVLSAIGD